MCQSFRETVMGFNFFGMGFDLAKYNFAKEIINRGEVILENNWRAGEGNMIWDWKIVKTHLSSVKSLGKKTYLSWVESLENCKNTFILSEKFGEKKKYLSWVKYWNLDIIFYQKLKTKMETNCKDLFTVHCK